MSLIVYTPSRLIYKRNYLISHLLKIQLSVFNFLKKQMHLLSTNLSLIIMVISSQN